jgi:hypothetical protein
VTSTIGLYQGWRLHRGTLTDLSDVRMPSVVNAALALLTIILSNWIYIPYRAPAGPRAFFLEQPMMHKVQFEFNGVDRAVRLPLAVGAAFMH